MKGNNPLKDFSLFRVRNTLAGTGQEETENRNKR